MRIKKVYIASPLFNTPERRENKDIDMVLRANGYETFLPQRDGFLYSDLETRLMKTFSKEAAEKIAVNLILHLDVYQVCKVCDATVLNLNGCVPDGGAVSEAAMCFRNGKPLVIYKQDSRSLFDGKDNPLIVGLTGFEVVTSIGRIPNALKKLEKVTESSYSRIMRNAEELFKNYDPKNKRLDKLISKGKEYFSD